MTTTASLEPGLGEGWAEWRLVFSLRGPLPGTWPPFPTHSSQTAYVQGSEMLGANYPLLLPCLSVAGSNKLGRRAGGSLLEQSPA